VRVRLRAYWGRRPVVECAPENGERGYQLTFAIAHIRDIFRLGVSGAYRAD
jgi:hypothetical protein